MNEKYKLTIIMTNYNQEKYISESIDSVLSQAVDFHFKLVIADDYSCQDRSREIINSYANKNDDIVAIFSNKHEGYLSNVLRIIGQVKTKYICLLDADDYWTDNEFLQRAYTFLESHDSYAIYESNVYVISELKNEKEGPFLSSRYKSGTYSKEMLMNNQFVPITQTTGMVFRNSIFKNGIPNVMEKAVGTRSERSFEGDTGRFMMHLKEGLAYYDSRIIGVYRLTEDGIWNSLRKTQKMILSARLYFDLHQYYRSNEDFFVNKAYKYLQVYLSEKQKELLTMNKRTEFFDEYEKLIFNDV